MTDAQQRVIEHRGGHARVSAAAGSGKTATLVARVVELLRRGEEPGRLRVLMFNRSAREEFEHRLEAAIALSGQRAVVSVQTFHQAGYRFLQRLEADGVVPQQRLESGEWAARKLARAALGRVLSTAATDLDDDELDAFLGFVDAVKADVVPPEAVSVSPWSAGGVSPTHYVAAYRAFETLRGEQQLRFLNDLIYEPVQALLADDALAGRFRNHFDHLIIDEYQDVNEAQQQLIRCIAGERAEVMVVGDPDQCVYQWRGARPEYIVHRFGEDFPGAAHYTLPHTFRFGHSVALLGNHIVTYNRQRDGKLCLAAAANPPTELHRCRDDDPQLYRDIVAAHVGNGGRLADIAVLVRLYSLAAPVELELLEAGVPIRFEGRSGFFQRREIHALLGYLHHAAGSLRTPAADEATLKTLLTEMLMLPVAGVRRSEAVELAQRCAQRAAPIERTLAAAAAAFSPWKARRLRERIAFLESFDSYHGDDPAGAVVDDLIQRLGFFDALIQATDGGELAADRAMLCATFQRFAAHSGRTLNQLLAHCATLCARSAAGSVVAGDDAVQVTSIHRAKGLQWPVVVVPGLMEGAFPYCGPHAEAGELEAERRLFYVAATRAQRRLYLVHPDDAALERALAEGRGELLTLRRGSASRFLYEAQPGRSAAAGSALHRGEPPPPEAKSAVVEAYLAAMEGESP